MFRIISSKQWGLFECESESWQCHRVGGHWVQLLRLRPAFDGHDVAYVSVQSDYAEQVPGARFYCVRDATRWSRWDLVKMMAQVTWVLIRERPDVVISTGAAPGVAALWFSKLIDAKTKYGWIGLLMLSLYLYQVKKLAKLPICG